ncbi:aldehyde dehydrogenase family protein [Sporanaerobacter acetigenes]|uniref:Betaine-aldehyde dehydrogenase n=1 Tax=Sporanaerobacter acetigenes DSM 13106 TaxID=1123281 RepID=A0A1M5ZA01_9FIRM|nr:aldehyde dehydrogenase family protein [Sporanaerobacter acetigenes]SHI20723.1 betaine-aldehyde dehydrogenase [Sporanaerobacter acetigenes DSM 13106]
MKEILKMYINGEWVLSESGKVRNIINPANNEIIVTVTDGTEEDVIKATNAAQKAFYDDDWMGTQAVERARLLYKVADLLEENLNAFAELETLNTGKPIREAETDITKSITCFRYYAGLATKPHGMTYEVPDDIQALVVREPIGVCGIIVPWNFPLLMAVWQLAPALAAGNTIILKPSELTPLTAIKLFEVFEKVGFPKGVVNLVLGNGKNVGAEIAANVDVDKISFTGGTKTGKSIMVAASSNIKKMSLELGGKSPNIVFEDVDLDIAVDYALFSIFTGQGQVCVAGSRLLLQESIYDKFIYKLVERAQKIRVGNGKDKNTEMGPLISEAHMNKVLNYIEIGKNQGATLVCGGNRILDGELQRGFFVEPTIFINTTPNMRIVQEEIFGPVLVVQKFRDEEEAIYLANKTNYGLAGAVFTNDISKAHRVIKKLRAGITWINTYHTTFNEGPWGGYKQSGIGRGLGTFGYEAYTEVKQININMNIKPIDWFSK